MENEFVPDEQALDLHELGFDKPCLAFYFKGERDECFNLYYRGITGGFFGEQFNAPTYRQAFKFFREKYGLNISSPLKKKKDLGCFWGGFIQADTEEHGNSYGSNYETYEEAELACLKQLIGIVKKQNNHGRN